MMRCTHLITLMQAVPECRLLVEVFSSLIPMVMMAVGHEVVAVMQVTDHTADALTIDIAQQGDNLCFSLSTHRFPLLLQNYKIFPFWQMILLKFHHTFGRFKNNHYLCGIMS